MASPEGRSSSNDLHDRAGDLFCEALELPPHERAAYLRQACGEDEELLREVTSLLSASERGCNLLQGTAIDLFPEATPPCVYECPTCGDCTDAGGTCEKDGAPRSVAFFGPRFIDGKYRLEQRLGGGGMGTVYRACHVGLGREFALKVLHAEQSGPEFLRLFEGEAKALGALRHPGVVSVTDYGVDPSGTPYLVMDLLAGATLQSGVPERECLQLLQQMASAVDYIHGQGIVHGDLKPSNVLLAPHPVLIDFGLAAVRSGAGTTGYMAPEVVRGAKPTRASDIYSFGAMACQLRLGRIPAPQEPLDVSLRPLLAALAEAPEDRPTTATEYVRQVVDAWRSKEQSLWRKRENPRRVVLAALGAILLAAAAPTIRQTSIAAYCENKYSDAILSLRPASAPDPRLLLITVDDRSLAADPRPLTALADDFGRRLEDVFQAGAQAMAIDLLLPASWGGSQPFVNLLLRHHRQITLGLLSKMGGGTVGAECIGPLLSAALSNQVDPLFAFVNLQEDGDGVVRTGNVAYADRAGRSRLTFAFAAAEKVGSGRAQENRFLIDYSTAASSLERISWMDLPDMVRRTPGRFRGRLIFVGGEYAGSGDTFRGSRREELSGLAVQSLIASTALRGFPLRASPIWFLSAWTALLTAINLGYFLLMPHTRTLLVMVSGAALILTAPLLCVTLLRTLAPAMTPLFCWLLAAAFALTARRFLPAFPHEMERLD